MTEADRRERNRLRSAPGAIISDLGPRRMEKWLDIGAAAFALAAAVFWFKSAYGTLPPMVTYWGSTPDTDAFFQALKFSAKMNTVAAGLSCVFALLMGLKMFVSTRALEIQALTAAQSKASVAATFTSA